MYWCSEEFDRLHFAALKELDEAKRNEMYIQMQQLWDEAAHTDGSTGRRSTSRGSHEGRHAVDLPHPAYLNVPAFTVE